MKIPESSAGPLISRFYLRTARIDGADMSVLRLPPSLFEELGWRPGVMLCATAMSTGDPEGNKVVLTLEES